MLTILLPIFGWGLMPIIANLRKSSPYEQLLGTSITALLFSTVVYFVVLPEITVQTFAISFLSGIFWSIGQLLQFKAIQLASVSKVMPISNGSQLVITTLLSVLLFHEWTTSRMYLVGTLSIALIIVGITLTGYQKVKEKRGEHFTKVVLLTICSSSFLALYVTTNQIFNIRDYQIVFPQSVGMLITALVIFKLFSKEAFSPSRVGFNLFTGLSWSIANIGMFVASVTLGVALSFSISQMCVIVATLGGIFVFKEKKVKIEWIMILSGILLIMIGVFFLSQLK